MYDDEIYVTSDEIYSTTDGSGNWDFFGNTVYDECMGRLSEKMAGLTVSDFIRHNDLDFEILLGEKIKIQLFSGKPHDDENWRIIVDGVHYVCRGKQIIVE